MAERTSLLQQLAAAVTPREKAMSMPSSSAGGWFPIIREAFAGAWQRNVTINRAEASAFYVNFSCITLIARDIAKLGVRLVKKDADGIWTETTNPSFSPVLRKPNHYQTRNQFWESWIASKLHRGNTYVLKVRDNRHIVVALFVLNPDRVQPLIADDGSVFYRLSNDYLNELPAEVIVPATEIIHDRMNCLDHPLIGIPPIMAAALAAQQGLNIQKDSIRLFGNRSTPGGVLSSAGHIEDETAARIKKDWEEGFGGVNSGRTAVLGDGLKFERMALTADEAQLIEQLKWTGEVVCSVYHMPAYKAGVGAMPAYNNVQALNVEYYSQCLQSLIEDAESCLDEGLGLGEQYDLGVEFDVDNLLRMDSATLMEMLDKGKNIMTPDEARRRINLPKVEGGNVVYRQQQDFSLAALAKRDAQADPFAKVTAPATPAEVLDPPNGGKSISDKEMEAFVKVLDGALMLARAA